MVIIKWIVVFTLMQNDGSISSAVIQQTADSLDNCKAAEQMAERLILENIQKGELKNGYAICKMIKVNLPKGREI